MSLNSNGQPPNQRPPTTWVAEIFAQLETPLLAYVARRVRNPQAARDMVQEAFVKLCQQPWPEIKEHAQAWLYRTCRNRTIDWTRREGRMSAIRASTDVSTLHDPAGNEPGELASRDEELARMRVQIRALPERQQELLRLRLQDGLSYKQIAEITGLSVTNVGFLLHQAVSRLRERMRVC